MLPEKLPRYRLCSLPSRALTEVYGMPIVVAPAVATDKETSLPIPVPVAAYLSSMGAIDTSDPLELEAQSVVETAFIVVHGSGRNPDDYLCCAQSAALSLQADTTMILAPWFLAPKDKVDNITTTTTGSTTMKAEPLRWTENGPIAHTWRYGADSIQHNVSSYAVVDEMVHRFLSDHKRFPSLRRIVVAGHSAGGQYVQRWALLSNGPAFADPAHSYIPRVPTRAVVANPKSLCWLDERRVFDGTLRIPEQDAIFICPTYNEWEWGFDNSTRSTERDKLEAPYKDEAIRDAGGIEAVVARYPSRDIVYLAGEKDVLLNGDCEAKMQGRFRRERSENYFASLRLIYGRPVHHRYVVSGVHHDHCLMFQSPEGRHALFGEDEETMASQVVGKQALHSKLL